MSRFFKVFIFLLIIAVPVLFFRPGNDSLRKTAPAYSPLSKTDPDDGFLSEANSLGKSRGAIAIIFDDLGGSLSELKDIYALDTPLTISVIPGLKFSRNIAHIGARCGFSVFIHLPLEPEDEQIYNAADYKIISTEMTKREVEALLRYYLNSIRIAIGVNNHMGSKATQDTRLLNMVVKAVKKKGLIFVDSMTSLDSVAYQTAKSQGLTCDYSWGFLDSGDDQTLMQGKMEKFIKNSGERGKIIIIAHPRENTINFLKKNLPELKKKVDFITIKEYFDL